MSVDTADGDDTDDGPLFPAEITFAEEEDEEFTKLVAVAMGAQDLFGIAFQNALDDDVDTVLSPESMTELLRAHTTAEGVAYASHDEAVREDVSNLDDELLEDVHAHLVPIAEPFFGVELDLPPAPEADGPTGIGVRDIVSRLGWRGS